MPTSVIQPIIASQGRGRARSQAVLVRNEVGGWSIDNGEPIPDLGFSTETAAQARRRFAGLLMELGKKISAKAPESLLPLPTDPDEAMRAVEYALTLDAADLAEEEDQLRDIGLQIYNKLSGDVLASLRDFGILEAPGLRCDDRQLAFILTDNTKEFKTPICWNMIYQEDAKPVPPQVSWDKFWGFRLPITQWVRMSRDSAIRLPSAFVATDESLPFSQVEKRIVAQRFPYSYSEFGELFDRYVDNALRDVATVPEIHSWWQQNKVNKLRLACLLDKIYPDSSLRNAKSKGWKQRALAQIFTAQSYSLLHFACHCEAIQVDDDPNSSKRMINLYYAGEEIPIDSTTMTNYMARKRRRDWRHSDDGPLVFLNACASGKATNSQFPDLPQEWIDGQGAKAVIATICDVPDLFAFAFALKLYRTLFSALEAGHIETRSTGDQALNPTLYIADALLQTRRYFLENFNNPMGLAYELYAVPDARLDPT